MIAILLCVLALGVTFWAGRRSLPMGLIVLLAIGYFYGILRANLLSTASHFIFDAGLAGLFLSNCWKSTSPAQPRNSEPILFWLVVLISWAVIVCLLPFQPPAVSIVGLRGNTFLLPMLFLGSRLRDRHLLTLANGLSVLNMAALGFAVAEYFLGVQQFYPVSPVTLTIYISGDVGDGYFRIPAIFSSAHAYGGTMLVTLPLLFGAWTRALSRAQRLLSLAGISAAMAGILLSATRTNFALGCGALLVVFFMTRMKPATRLAFVLLVVAAAIASLTNVRFQRFKSLADTDAVVGRIAGSVNRSFWEILMQYPMGNGLGGGGSSMPHFLQAQVRNPIGLENEYSRIACEQGVIGLLLWCAFIGWYVCRGPVAFQKGLWQSGRRLAWCLSLCLLATGLIGIGMLTSIPASALLLLSIGWSATTPVVEVPEPSESNARQRAQWSPGYRPAY
jgi:hypothetical protein